MEKKKLRKLNSKENYKNYKPHERVPAGMDIAEARPEAVGILIDAFNIGMNITQSCHQAGISRDTYYEWIKKDKVLSDRIAKARSNPERLVKATLFMKLQKESLRLNEDDEADVPTTRWWAERKLRDEFSIRTENINTEITVEDIHKKLNGEEDVL